MEQLKLSAKVREEFGKGPSGRLRRSGFIPANLYGPKIEKNVSISIETRELERALHGHGSGNVLITLDVEGHGKKTVMFKELQRHPAMGTIEHIDLVEILMDKSVTVDVPVHIVGRAEGVNQGGILQQETRTLKIECLPKDMPESIDVDVESLEVGQSVHVGDITFGKGLQVLDDPKSTIVSVVAPTIEEEVKTPEELEAELAESFEEGEGEEKAEGEKPGEKPAEKAEGKAGEKAEGKPGEKAEGKKG